jgi:hypothetical protein
VRAENSKAFDARENLIFSRPLQKRENSGKINARPRPSLEKQGFSTFVAGYQG